LKLGRYYDKIFGCAKLVKNKHMMKQNKVIIVGAGIAGLTAATDLIEQGYEVEVHETKMYAGGKAYGFHDEKGFPIEHSCRIYSKYYSLYSYMKRIPYKNSTVFHNLIQVKPYIVSDEKFFIMPDLNRKGVFVGIKNLWDGLKLIRFLQLSPKNILFLVKKGIHYKFSSSYRKKLNTVSFKKEMLYGQDQKFQKFIVQLLSILIAARPNATANVMFQELYNFIGTGWPLPEDCHSTFHLLNGPTSEHFLHPWIDWLKGKGVTFVYDSHVSIQDKEVYKSKTQAGRPQKLAADAYLFCLSLKSAKATFPKENLPSIQSEMWSNGIQFYLKKRPSNFPKDYIGGFIWNKPWHFAMALYDNNVSWKNVKMPKGVKCIASATFSNVVNKGVLYGKSMKECTPTELVNETMEQCGINRDDVVQYFIDPAIRYENNTWHEDMALYVVTPHDYPKMKTGETQFENIFLVGEFTKTKKENPSMEKSCEAGKIGAQRIIDLLNQ